MGQAKKLEGGVLHGLEDEAQRAAQGRAADDDVVVSPKDDPPDDKAHRQAVKQALQAAAGIDVDVRRQAVAPGARQVVDQGDVAEVVLAPPINAMRLEGITPVGAEEHQAAPRAQDAHDLADGQAVVLDVLQHLVAEHQVEGIGWKRQILGGSAQHLVGMGVSLDGALVLDIQAHPRAGIRRQVVQVGANPAAVDQQAAWQAVPGIVQDHLQAPFLPRPPDVRGFAAQSGFGGMGQISK